MWFLMGEFQKEYAFLPMGNLGMFKAYEPKRWACTSKKCKGYIYDPVHMDGIAFEERDKKWKCPCCGAKKKSFEKTNKRVPV